MDVSTGIIYTIRMAASTLLQFAFGPLVFARFGVIGIRNRTTYFILYARLDSQETPRYGKKQK